MEREAVYHRIWVKKNSAVVWHKREAIDKSNLSGPFVGVFLNSTQISLTQGVMIQILRHDKSQIWDFYGLKRGSIRLVSLIWLIYKTLIT